MSRHFKDVSHAIADGQPAWQMLKEPSPNAAESKTFEWKRTATGFTVVLSMRQRA